jgi:hypothetical protein
METAKEPADACAVGSSTISSCNADTSYYKCLVGDNDPLGVVWSSLVAVSVPLVRNATSLVISAVSSLVQRLIEFGSSGRNSTVHLSFLDALPSHWPESLRQSLWDSSKVASSEIHASSTTVPDVSQLLLKAEHMLLDMLDSNGDGQVTSEELFRFTEMILQQQKQSAKSYWLWIVTTFSTQWPLLELRLGYFLWRVAGGTLFVLWLLTIVPGRLHGWAGRVLRWPVLGMTYLMISAEVSVNIGIH